MSRAVITTKAFVEAVKEVLPFAEGGKHVVVLELQGGDGESLAPGALTLEAVAEDLGETTTTIAATVDGPDQRVIYDIRYLADALAVIKTPEAAIELTSDHAPAVFRPIGSIDYMCVVTPLTKNAALTQASAGAASTASSRTGATKRKG